MVFLVKPLLSFPTNERSERVSPAPATKLNALSKTDGAFLVLPFLSLDITRIVLKTEFTFEVRYCLLLGLMTIPSGNTSFCIFCLVPILPDSQSFPKIEENVCQMLFMGFVFCKFF